MDLALDSKALAWVRLSMYPGKLSSPRAYARILRNELVVLTMCEVETEFNTSSFFGFIGHFFIKEQLSNKTITTLETGQPRWKQQWFYGFCEDRK
jgi:hypothetical protein